MNAGNMTEARSKKPYAAPQLVSYGDVRALTRSGAGSMNEQRTGMGGCSNDRSRKPC